MELTSLSATTLARMIARKKCSAREIFDAHHKRYETYNPQINAIIATHIEAARAQADKADEATAAGQSWGPFHGVPVTVKDTFDTIDMPTTIGIPWLKNNRPKQDAAMVTRLRQTGAILWGKSSLPFSSYDWQCDHPTAGSCLNPWDLTHSPGGSSGGSAAAVAAGFSPMELGSDVAGSIRQPAHSCGVYGLRTTEGLLSGAGHGRVPGSAPTLRNHMSVGPLSRDPEDMSTLLPLLFSHDTKEGRQALALADAKPLRDTRIAWTESWGGIPLCDDTKATLHNFITLLKDAGAHVEESALPFDLESTSAMYGTTHGFEYAAALPSPLRWGMSKQLIRRAALPLRFGRGAFSKYVGRGITASPTAYFYALKARDKAIQAFDDWFASWDLWVTPVAATTAFKHKSTGKSVQIDGTKVAYCDVAGMYCCPTAALAHPILNVPAGQSQDGLPIGLQLHGRRWHDLALLEYATEIASLLPPFAMPDLTKSCGKKG